MIEFLQSAFDMLAKIIPTLTRNRREREAAKLGSELLLIYVESNEALLLGEKIISSLEDCQRRTRYHVEARGEPYPLTHEAELPKLVENQLRNIVAINKLTARLSWPLQVLNGEEKNRLELLLGGKSSILKALQQAVLSKRLPLLSSGLRMDEMGVLHAHDPNVQSWTNRLPEFFGEESVPLVGGWDLDAADRVVTYLDTYNPRDRLTEIRVIIERIHTTLTENFSVSDIIQNVGDPRALRQLRSPFDY